LVIVPSATIESLKTNDLFALTIPAGWMQVQLCNFVVVTELIRQMNACRATLPKLDTVLACEDFISADRVFLNRKGAEFGQNVNPTVDKIAVDGESIPAVESLISITLYKQRSVLCFIRVFEIMIVPRPTILPKLCCLIAFQCTDQYS
jgi:hypothetical protein